uniref:UDP-glucuronosyltransferase n=1 Tax=Cuerna arida TaxID=1464854 RepID=A0A1B6FL46_9HEMI
MKLLAGLFLTMLSLCDGLKILAVLPFPMKSHHIIFNVLLGELMQRGHHLTVYSNSPILTNASNYKHVYVTTSLEAALDKKLSFDAVKARINMEAFIRPMGFQLLTKGLSEEFLSLPQVEKLLASTEKFDVVIMETFFGQEALIGFGHRFKAPVVTLSSFGTFSLVDSIMGNPNPLSYFTTYQLAFTSELTFYQKLKNVIATMSEHHYSYFHHLPSQEAVMLKHFQKYEQSPLPSLVDLLSEIGVVLLNTQPEVSYARAWLPNMVSVGGLHIPKVKTSHPKEIQTFIDGAEDGIIYFSLGSTLSGTSIPDYVRDAFRDAFSRIPERVIWKIDTTPPGLPPNVMVVAWTQQSDILADPKCKAFITHAGLLSLLEAVHFAVPLIGVPVFADQPWNMVKAEQAKIGVHLNILNISTDYVSWALEEILHNPVYKRNMDQLSAQMRDRLVSPLDTAAYWVEYVAKHQGAPQLRSPARHMSSFRYLLVDVVLFLLAVTLLFILALYFLLRKIYKLAKYLFTTTMGNKIKTE